MRIYQNGDINADTLRSNVAGEIHRPHWGIFHWVGGSMLGLEAQPP